MNCAWLKERLPRPEVELWRYGRPSAVLLEHARTCTECARTIENEARVKALLLALGETTRGTEPSPEIYGRLVREAEERFQKPVPAEPRWKWLRVPQLRWAFAAAGVAAAAGLAVQIWTGPVQEQPAPVAPPAPVVANSAKPAPKSSPKKAATAPVAAPKIAEAQTRPAVVEPQARPVREPEPAAVARQEDYYPLVMCDAYSCEGDAVEVRVTVPAPTFWPAANGTRSTRGVDANLLVGEDGMVRGIKFVE